MHLVSLYHTYWIKHILSFHTVEATTNKALNTELLPKNEQQSKSLQGGGLEYILLVIYSRWNKCVINTIILPLSDLNHVGFACTA